MSATQFTVDMNDIKFVLFEQFDIDGKLGKIEKYADFDKDTYESILEEAERIATEVLAPLNGPGDRQGCRLEGNDVITPDGFKAAWDTIVEGGWVGISAPPEVGGMGLPTAMYMTINEMMAGAASAFWMYPGLTAGAARILAHHPVQGLPEGKGAEFAEQMFLGQFGGTMCLTEAGAGSSVGDNRTKATPTDTEGVYNIEGEKIFISGGDQDLTDNIVHLVLAKTPGAPEGTKGLSLFLVSKFHVNDDMSLGDRNDARVVGIEHKMGINGSATCSIAFGANGPCTGYLIGDEFKGIRIMFEMMNEARLGVGAQGQAVAAAAYNYALAYANERIQGTSLANMRDADADRVAIVQHADVRRMLMTMKCQTEAMRSFLFRLGILYDLAEASTDPEEKARYQGEVDLLVPVLKSYCSDKGFDIAVLAVQIYGGYGFIGEYPVEQLVRDGKIFSIYEGTNGIQAMDLLGRKLRMKGGALFMGWIQQWQAKVAEGVAAGFETEAGAIGKALGHVGATAMHLGQLGMQGKMEGAMVQSVPFLNMMGNVQLALELLDQALVAKKLIDENGENAHLKGKLLNLKFYTANLLPAAIAAGKAIQGSDESCLDEVLFKPAS